MIWNKSAAPYFLITLLGAVLFIPFLGKVHLFDWDEINFAESAREMIVTGNYTRVMIDYQPFWEKPPLFFWLQAASMHAFGINEFAARFPNAICGIITLCLIFFIGRKYFDDTFGWLWVLAYIGSFLPHLYFKSGIIDPWFNLFIFSGIAFLIWASEHYDDSKRVDDWSGISTFPIPTAFAGFFTGLAILTKGPVALAVVGLTAICYTFISKKYQWFHLKSAITFFGLVALSFFLSFAIINKDSSDWLPIAFFKYQVNLMTTQVAGHGGPFYYHVIVLLLGCFPASIISLNSFFKKQYADERQTGFRRWMVILFFVVLILFSIVQTKIIHYSSLCYLPLTFLAAWEIYFRIKKGERFSNSLLVILLLIGIVAGSAAAMLPTLGNDVSSLLPYIKDSMTKASLEANVDWPAGLTLIGIGYVLLVITGTFRMKSNLRHGVILLFAGTCIFIQAVLFAFVPRIERYTQGAAIDFYKTLQSEDVYVEVLGFKSYAHLFYTMKQPQQNQKSRDKDWLLNGEIDKPAYFVCKINKEKEYKAYPQFKEISRKNGFVFFKRELP